MDEFKERVNEIIQDLRGRFGNPLMLSFLIVWFYFHWQFVYEILTIDNSLPVFTRSTYFKGYIKSQGWDWMVGWPLLISLGSLIVFYFLGGIGNFIKLWLGKRFPASIMAKWDTGKYDLKSETKKFKNRATELTKREIDLTGENDFLKTSLQQKKSELEDTKKFNVARETEKNDEIGNLKAIHTHLESKLENAENAKKLVEQKADKLTDNLNRLKIEKDTLSGQLAAKEATLEKYVRSENEEANLISRVSTNIFSEGSRWRYQEVFGRDIVEDTIFTFNKDVFIGDSDNTKKMTFWGYSYNKARLLMQFNLVLPTTKENTGNVIRLIPNRNETQFSGFDLTREVVVIFTRIIF